MVETQVKHTSQETIVTQWIGYEFNFVVKPNDGIRVRSRKKPRWKVRVQESVENLDKDTSSMNAWNPYLECEYISILKPKPMVRVRRITKPNKKQRVNYDVKPHVYIRVTSIVKPKDDVRVKLRMKTIKKVRAKNWWNPKGVCDQIWFNIFINLIAPYNWHPLPYYEK